MIYDQTQNPRYLDPVPPEEPYFLPDRLLAQKYEDLNTIAAVLDLTDFPGWEFLMRKVQEEKEIAEKKALRASDLETLKLAQGAIATCNWLLTLQEEYARARERLSDEVAHAERTKAREG